MSRWIILTTIQAPTACVKAWAAVPGWRLLAVGDRKTPPDWACPGAEYLGVPAQESLDSRLARELPWNHYCRKMLGYLEAIRAGAEAIVDTDDDNMPKPNWAVPSFSGAFESLPQGRGFVNIYRLYAPEHHLWPRGFPLRLINDRGTWPGTEPRSVERAEVGIWQGLADGDPDVDAIYRLTSDVPTRFGPGPEVVLQPETLCPFNSQNTAFRREVFPLLYLPARVTFRFTDILRGLVAQPILWHLGLRLGFTPATVVQERNPHDYLKDFESELPMYLRAHEVPELVSASLPPGGSATDCLWSAYTALRQHGIVEDAEMRILDAWASDLNPSR